MPATIDLWLTSTEAWLHRQDILTASLSQGERERRDRFVDPRVGLRFALGRGLLRAVLARRLGIDPRAVQFEIGEAGKPRLARSADELRFNVSASQEHLAIAICSTCDVGVDVECQRPVSDGILRSPSVLSESERDRLARLPAEERAGAFLRWWVRKEAVAKADGRGVGFGLHRIEAGPMEFDGKPRIVLINGHSFIICDSEPIAGVYCAVAASTPDPQLPPALIRHVDYANVVG